MSVSRIELPRDHDSKRCLLFSTVLSPSFAISIGCTCKGGA